MKKLKQFIAVLPFAVGGIIATSEQQHLWQTAVGVALLALSVPLLNRAFDVEPEKYPEE